MPHPRPPPLIERLPKALAVGVVGFIVFPGTLTATAAFIVGSQSTVFELHLTHTAVAALAVAVLCAATYAVLRPHS
jgi:Mg/Co/Ni transporter MgtE